MIEALPATAQLVAPLPQLPLMGAQMLPQPTQPFDQAGIGAKMGSYDGWAPTECRRDHYWKWGYKKQSFI